MSVPKVLRRMGYSDAVKHLGKRYSAPINGGNARLVRADNGDILYRLWDTVIVTFHPDNTATMNTYNADEGEQYRTATTKRHLGVAAYVAQDKGVWYVGDTPFYDGMRVDLGTGAILE